LPIQFTVVFSGPVSDFTSSDVTVSGTSKPRTWTVSGSGATYTVTVTNVTKSGTVVASVAAGMAHDGNGTPNNASTSTDNTVTYTRALQAASGEATTPVANESLTMPDIEPLLAEAIRRWQATGADVSVISKIEVRLADLEDGVLGMAEGNTIWLDLYAAGYGWFIDATLWEDSEFASPADQGEQCHMDLLTAIAYEMGHMLGHDHEDGGVMVEKLALGAREYNIVADPPTLLNRARSLWEIRSWTKQLRLPN
jgi:hypothetical protein